MTTLSSDCIEELEVLQSIYGDCLLINNQVNNQSSPDYTCIVSYTDPFYAIIAHFNLPPNYPLNLPIVTVQHINNSSKSTINCDDFRRIEQTIRSVFSQHPGEIVLFTAIEEMRGLIQTLANETTKEKEVNDGAINPDHDPDNRIDNEDENKSFEQDSKQLQILHGPITTEQKSSFQSHMGQVTSMTEVNRFYEIIMKDKKVARATHNIFAYRFVCPISGIMHHDSDDDGETAAGSRLLEMIRLMNIDGIAIIVTRWFGGILLGPDRFKYICNSARDLILTSQPSKVVKTEHQNGKRKIVKVKK